MNEEIVIPEDSGAAGEEPISQIDPDAHGLGEEKSSASDEESVQVEDSKLDKRVADTQAALKESQKEYHELRESIAEMRGQLSGLTAPPQTEERDYLDDEAWREKFNDDPAAAYVEAIKTERAKYAELLQQRDGYNEHMRQQMISDAVNPEVAELHDAIAELGKHDWFKVLNTKGQIEAAKSFSAAQPAKPQTRTPSSMGPGGTGRRAVQIQQNDARTTAAEAQVRAIWGDDKDDVDDMYPMTGTMPKGGK